SSHRNQQMLSEISGKRQLAEIEQMRRGRAMQALMMQSGAGVDDQQVLTQLFQTNPAVYGELEGDESFQKWQTLAGSKKPADVMESKVHLSDLMQRLSANPRYAEIVQKLKQQQALAAFLAP